MRPADNEILCRVEGEAPMGRLMRQHWLPACMSEEVASPDGPPVRSRLLGEDLVIFRDSSGRLGALGEFCPHRGASLFFGRNEDCGLRCLYHGWKFDVAGNVVDMPSEPADSRMCQRVTQKSWPVREAGGFVWVWMGSAEKMPELDAPAWAPSATTKISIVKMHAACNWAQVLEGSIDSAHSSSLHSSNMPAADVQGSTAAQGVWLRPSLDKSPRLQIQLTRWGFRYAALRTPINNPETHHYVRTTVFIAPFTVLIPPNDQYNLAQMLVPIDDVNCMFYWIAWHETKGINQDAWRRFCAAEVGVDLDQNFRKLRNFGNNYRQDRAAMNTGDFTGITGIPTQDMAMWESMGPIADRSRDRLGSSDLAIVQFRRQMLAAARRVRDGEPAIGTTEPRVPHVQLASFEGVVEKTVDWRILNISEAERATTALDVQVSALPSVP